MRMPDLERLLSDRLDLDALTPRLEDLRLVSDGWIKKYELVYRMPSGETHVYESVSRKAPEAYRAELLANASGDLKRRVADAVSIVARTPDDRIVLIREFRYPLNSWCIAFPAGLIDPGEDAEQAIERELREETGFALARDDQGRAHLRMLTQPGYSSAGMSGESVQIAYVHVEREPRTRQDLQDNELIEVFTVAMRDLPEFMEKSTAPIGTRTQLVLEAFANNQRRYGDPDGPTPRG